MLAVETTALSYQFPGTEPVLRDVELAVPQGSIYGFLGPNGAGKTTTLRLLLGLLRHQHGRIRVLGMDVTTHRTAILARTGSLIESPSVYGQLTAAENLRIWQVVAGCPVSRIADVLRQVGLADTGSKRAGNFSLGMRQRLGVAVALLTSPDLLVLDEPTNGLDPAGIVEMRELLRTLNRETGVTVLLSSHLLPEIERLVTHVGVLKCGQLVFQGSLPVLVERAAATACSLLACDDNTRAIAALALHGWSAKQQGDRIWLPPMPPAELARANRVLVLAGVGVHELRAERQDLEAIFMDLVGN